MKAPHCHVDGWRVDLADQIIDIDFGPTWIGIDHGKDRDIGFAQIGPHRLFHGDAYAIRPTLGWMDADVMDPPYEFDNSGGGKWRAARGASEQIIAEGLTKGFDHAIINPLLCGAVVVFCHDDQLPDLLPFMRGSFHRHRQCFWHKICPAPHHNKAYVADTETYIHGWQRGFNPVGTFQQLRRSVEAQARPAKIWGHATVKPDKVMDKIIANVNGRTICDPFMGTGSTGVAAIKAGRIFTGIEHNPKHFETAVKRISAAWEEYQRLVAEWREAWPEIFE